MSGFLKLEAEAFSIAKRHEGTAVAAFLYPVDVQGQAPP